MTGDEHEACPTSDSLGDLLTCELDPPRREALVAHLDQCLRCHEFVAALARFDEEPHPTVRPRPIDEGQRLGQYTVGRHLGAGTMGSVHEAYDQVLERRVALKFIHETLTSSATTRSRVFEEARAMARVSHQNIAQVYEAAAVDEQLFIAMELIEGPTLSQWLAHGDRDQDTQWSIVDVFIGIGHGLHAAHAAGVVHRDFKPDNVLVTATRLPKVVDFGLAQTGQTGTIAGAGTPLFMAPEVLKGRPADARSDQFSFSVTLYRALCRRPPFAGDSLAELAHNVLAGKLQSKPLESMRPTRLRRAVLRGLAVDPAERWPSMMHLVHELERSKRVRTHRRLWLGAAAIAAVGGTLGAAVTATETKACSDSSHELVGVWDDATRQAAATALEYEPEYARRVAAMTLTRLDDYADEWTAAHASLCESGEPDATSAAAEILRRRFACLGDARRALSAAASLLGESPAASADALLGILDTLPRVEACADVDALMADVPPPSDAMASRVAAVRDALARARAARSIGQPVAAAAAITEAQRSATHVDYAPVSAELHNQIGHVASNSGEFDAALQAYQTAFSIAIRVRYDHELGVAARRLAGVLAVDSNRFAEARIYGQIARDVAERGPAPEQIIDAEVALSRVELTAGRPEQALAHIEAALAVPSAAPLLAGRVHTARAKTLGTLGRIGEAQASYRKALQLDLQHLGPQHPTTALTRSGLAAALGAAGRLEDSLEQLDIARKVMAAAYPPDHAQSIGIVHNIAATQLALRQFESAEQTLRTLLQETRLPETHVESARLRRTLAMALNGQGRYSDAAVQSTAALGQLAESMQPDHLELALTKEVLVDSLAELGQLDQATRLLDEILASRVAQLPEDHPDILHVRTKRIGLAVGATDLVDAAKRLRSNLERLDATMGPGSGQAAYARVVLGKIYAAQGALDRQEQTLRVALSAATADSYSEYTARIALASSLVRQGNEAAAAGILTEANVLRMDPQLRADASFLRAQILWNLGTEHEAALRLAGNADAFYSKHRDGFEAQLQSVREWLDTRPAAPMQ